MGQTQIVTPPRGPKGQFIRGAVASKSPFVAADSAMIPDHIGLHEVISNDHMTQLAPVACYVLVSHGMVYIAKQDNVRPEIAFPSQIVPCAGHNLVQRMMRDLHTLFGLRDYEYKSERFVHLGQYFLEMNGKQRLCIYVGVQVTRYVGGTADFFNNFEWANSPMMAKFPFTENERAVLRAAKQERLIA